MPSWLNPYWPLIKMGLILTFISVVSWLSYARGRDDNENYHNKVTLAATQKELRDAQRNDNIADHAGKEHAQSVQVVHDTTREIVRTVTVPADADPFMPVWFVRLWDRLATQSPSADPYPGKLENASSDTRLSEVKSMLAAWEDKYYVCQKQVDDTNELNPVLPSPPEEDKGIFHNLNPFR